MCIIVQLLQSLSMKVHTLYLYQFLLKKLVCNVEFSKIMTCTFLAPSMPPQTLSVSVTSSRSLFLSWNAPPSESHNGIIRKYAVAIQSLLTGVEQTFTTLNRVFNVSSLNPYTSYSVRVAAITVETGPFTIPYNVTTFEDGQFKEILSM